MGYASFFECGMAGQVVGHLETVNVLEGLDHPIRDIRRTVLGEENLLAPEQFRLFSDIEQAPDIVVAELLAHPELRFGHVLAVGVVFLERDAEFACALIQQVAEDRDPVGRGTLHRRREPLPAGCHG
jgi:hypothetical protein